MPRFIRLDTVKELTGLSRSTIYADPNFPKPVKIGDRAVAWIEDEVSAWIDSKIEAREAA